MKKPVLGERPLSDLFSDFKYCRNVVTPKHGSRTFYPKGYRFVGCRGNSWRGSDLVLGGLPTPLTLETASPGMVGGDCGSFELIWWDKPGKYLLVARDSVHIGSVWVAFTDAPDFNSIEVHHAAVERYANEN